MGGHDQSKTQVYAPDALLSLVQAADWAGQPLSTIRRWTGSGALRSEVVRKDDREVQRIRMVDLSEWIESQAAPDETPNDSPPEVDAGSHAAPTPGNSESGGAASGPETPETKPSEPGTDPKEAGFGGTPVGEASPVAEKPAPKPDEATSASAAAPEPSGSQGSSRTGESPSAEQALEPTGAAPIHSELQDNWRWVRAQQDELREQCYELRQRLVDSESERRRAVDALMWIQERGPALALGGKPQTPIWKRPGTWVGATSLAIGLIWLTHSLSVLRTDLKSDLLQGQTVWAQELADHTTERLAFQASKQAAQVQAMDDRWSSWSEQQLQQFEQVSERLTAAQQDELRQQSESTEKLGAHLGAWIQEARLQAEAEAASQAAESERRRQWERESVLKPLEAHAQALERMRAEWEAQRKEQARWQNQNAAEWKSRERQALTESQRLYALVESAVAQEATHRVQMERAQLGAKVLQQTLWRAIWPRRRR